MNPPLPPQYTPPAEVGDWHYDPDAPNNGITWVSNDETTEVGIYSSIDQEITVKAIDRRIDGLGGSETLLTVSYNPPEDTAGRRKAIQFAVAEAIDSATAWMEQTPPDDWSHPQVCEAVFDPPPGYELAKYYISSSRTTIYYRKIGSQPKERLAGIGKPDEFSAETCSYLYLQVLNGSGNATIALAPWLYAHGPSSKHPEVGPILTPPDECGLEVALTMAHRWAAEHVATGDRSIMPSGQTDLHSWECRS